MNHQVSEVAPCRKKIECTYDAAEVDAAFDEGYVELRDNVSIKGFRRGRAPRRALERRYAKDIAKDVAGKLISKALEDIMKEDDINPMGDPVIDPKEPVAKPGEALSFAAEMDVRPVFELGEYKGLVLQEPSAAPTEEEVAERLEGLRENFADRTDIEEPAQPGDLLEVDAVVTVPREAKEGAEAKEGGEGGDEELLNLQDQWVKIDGETIFGVPYPDLVEKLTGAVAGDTVTFVRVMSTEYENEKLRGREVKSVLKVKAAQRLNIPTADELVAKIGLTDLDELKTVISTQIGRQKEEARHDKLQEQIVDQLNERMPFELPAEFVERQTRQQVVQNWMQLSRMGVSSDYIRENAGDMETKTRQQTERAIRWSIISDAIANKEEIEVTPDEVQAHIDVLARRNNTTPAQVAKSIRDQNGMYAIAQQIRDVKITRFLIDSAELKPLEEMSEEAKKREEKQAK